MSDTLKLIITKISEGKSANELCSELNLSMNRLHYYLRLIKNSGYQFSTLYDLYGETKFSFDPIKSVYESNGLPFLNVLVYGSTYVKVLAISDLHFGNELQRLDAVDAIFNYCVKKNIHIILCCGDLLDGTFSAGNQVIQDGMKQIEYFIENYPRDKNIVTLAVLGDHDFSILSKYNYDPAKIISNKRPDIAIGGYNKSYVRMKYERIILNHYIDAHLPFQGVKSNLILHGHSHGYTISDDNGVLNINVPSLSSIKVSVPSALELGLTFKDNFFSNISVDQLVVVNGVAEKINSFQFPMGIKNSSNEQLYNDAEKQKNKRIIKH